MGLGDKLCRNHYVKAKSYEISQSYNVGIIQFKKITAQGNKPMIQINITG